MKEEYTENQLAQIHSVLLDILKEVVRVCGILGIRPFVTGGTAIGAFYYCGFVRMDDDIDLGLIRNEYQLFVSKAPDLLSAGYFLQVPETDSATPFYAAKVRKDNTLFVEKEYKDLPIHQGIFVDIFPFDNVPDGAFHAKMHQRVVQFLTGTFRRRQMKEAILEQQAFLPSFISRPLATVRFKLLRIFPPTFYARMVHSAASAFNGKECEYMDVIKDSVDRLKAQSLRDLKLVKFEDVDIYAPGDIKAYLGHHYPKLKSADMLESLWISHVPFLLSFNTEENDTKDN